MAGRRGVAAIDAARLVAARKRARLSQAALGAKIGVHQARITRWESGAERPTVDQLPKLAAALQVDVLDLLQPGTPHSLEVLRIAAGLTQQALIERLRAEPHNVVMSRERWREIEQGRRPLPEWELDAIAEALGTTVQDVLAAVPGKTATVLIQLTDEQLEILRSKQLPGETDADTLDRQIRRD